MKALLLALGLFSVASVMPTQAKEAGDGCSFDADFHPGGREASLSAGMMFSPVLGVHRPTLNYAQQNLALGWMLTAPYGPGVLRGYWELLANLFGNEVTVGPGHWLAGGRVLLRYNFVPNSGRLVPFITVGGGGLYNDVFEVQSQRLIGGGFEFSLVADVGVRYLVSPRTALLLKLNAEHISNACTASRNVGCNALGGELGVSVFY
jgi:hypothetical protein